ncbi:hypothetical protein GGH12_002165 [Coemansia sp. RSA 1822]|nr:hypothetical protein LPJ76_005808 [Coemansia sp. RSA 638]KAJ2119948.1 hypothetical protein IW147_005462 [Coemansia sp. RSA 720]KAJ2564188.1 hypothetical protein GGH12_002165 [Coemansia sp. RSA 1822]
MPAQLDAQLRSCAELQRQLNQEDETQADILDKDRELMKAHAQCKAQMDKNVQALAAKKRELQELKEEFIALVDERDQLLVDNLNLQDDLELRAK